MFINNTSYTVDLRFVQTLRYRVLSCLTPNHMSIIESYIRRYIPCTDITYTLKGCFGFYHSFIIRIRKTDIKKIKGYKKNDVQFYYGLISKALVDLFTEQRDEIFKLLYDSYGKDATTIINICINNPEIFYGLFNAYCLADNILEIRM